MTKAAWAILAGMILAGGILYGVAVFTAQGISDFICWSLHWL